ncbi:hypothetical protein OAU50_04615 [Planctomycetota bacterium]|nr:hypothetical protein [Planctomycetota bacterium]
MKTNLIAAILMIGITFGAVLAQDPDRPDEPETAPCSQPESPAPSEPDVAPSEDLVKLVEFEDHHASNDIWGSWVVDTAASKLFHSKHEDDDMKGMTLTFTKDEAASDRIVGQMPKLHERMVVDKPDIVANMVHAMAEVYAAGKLGMTRGEDTREAAFALVVYRGQPMIMILEGTDEESFDWESIRYSYINDPTADDKLLLSGDMPDEAYAVLKRKE